MKARNRCLKSVAWVLFWATLSVWACRYSVRDTGFVDLGLESYRLRWVPGPRSPAADSGATLRARAEALLRDSNLVWDEEPLATGIPPGAGVFLRDVEGRVLRLPVADPSDPASVLKAVESAASSPLRERLYREGLRAYAVVLLVEGTDAVANARARQDIDTAIAATARLLASMPKPVEVPPQAVSLPIREQSAESVTLWGLGMEPVPNEAPRVAIVFGRGRRLGAALEGPLITQTALRDRLLLIGQDCECDLDRAWLRGPLLPGRWGREFQQAALTALGFDPGNPMVRAEISRIVERGPQNPGRRRPPSSGTSLGYSEDSVESMPETETESPGPSASASGSEVPSPRPASEASGGAPASDWGRRLWFTLAGAGGVLLATGLVLWFRASRR